MLELLPVSKFKLEQSQIVKRQKESHKKLFIDSDSTYDQQQIDPEDYQNDNKIESDSNYDMRLFENSALTRFLNDRIVIAQVSLMLLAVLSILLSMIQEEMSANPMIRTHVLAFHSANSLAMIALMILKHFQENELKRKQLIKISIKKSWQQMRNLIIQLIVTSIHPNLLTQHSVVYVREPINDTFIPLKINNIFEMIMLTRVYLILAAIVSISVYSSTRTNRICRIYNTKHDRVFGMKALFNNNPLKVLVLLFMIALLSLGQMLKISEGQHYEALNNLGNCMWCIIITMGTIGYGDYSPITYSGRIIAFLAAISGIIMSSLLILTLSTYLSMSISENKSHITLERLKLRQVLDKYSQQAITQTTAMLGHRKNGSQQNGKIKQCIEQLQKKTEKMKFTGRRIKNLMQTDNVSEETNRLFEVLADNLNDIYLNQLEYGKLLVKLYQQDKHSINQIKFSFTTEIEEIIKDR